MFKQATRLCRCAACAHVCVRNQSVTRHHHHHHHHPLHLHSFNLFLFRFLLYFFYFRTGGYPSDWAALNEVEYSEGDLRVGALGNKLGMTHTWDAWGKTIPLTVLELSSNVSIYLYPKSIKTITALLPGGDTLVPPLPPGLCWRTWHVECLSSPPSPPPNSLWIVR